MASSEPGARANFHPAAEPARGRHAGCLAAGTATSAGLERLYVRRVGPLGPRLGVVADLGTLAERLEAATGDATVVHEQVLAPVVGRDEPEALVVAEPLYGSGGHLFPPRRLCAAKRGRCYGNNYERRHGLPGQSARGSETIIA